MKDNKTLTIRNSTAEFLIFETQAKQDSIEVRYEDETLWLTQKMNCLTSLQKFCCVTCAHRKSTLHSYS